MPNNLSITTRIPQLDANKFINHEYLLSWSVKEIIAQVNRTTAECLHCSVMCCEQPNPNTFNVEEL